MFVSVPVILPGQDALHWPSVVARLKIQTDAIANILAEQAKLLLVILATVDGIALVTIATKKSKYQSS